MMNLKEKQCVPCRIGTPPLSNQEEDRLKKEVSSWTLTREKIHQLKKSYKLAALSPRAHFTPLRRKKT